MVELLMDILLSVLFVVVILTGLSIFIQSVPVTFLSTQRESPAKTTQQNDTGKLPSQITNPAQGAQ